MARKRYAFIDLTVFTNGCKVLIHTTEGLMSIEAKVPREVESILSRVVGVVPLVLLKGYEQDPLTGELITALEEKGIEIQKL